MDKWARTERIHVQGGQREGYSGEHAKSLCSCSIIYYCITCLCYNCKPPLYTESQSSTQKQLDLQLISVMGNNQLVPPPPAG